RIDPRNAAAACAECLDALHQGREEDGIALAEAALGHHPDDARLHYAAGLLSRQIDENEAAIGHLSRAAQLAPANAEIAHSLARVHLEAGLPSAGLFRATLSLAPQDQDAMMGLVGATVQDEGAAAGLALIEETVARNPHWLPGQELLAQLRWQNGDREGYTSRLEQALAAAPRNLALWRSLISARINAEDLEGALAAVRAGRAAAGHHMLFDANEAICLADLGATAEAEAWFARLGDAPGPAFQVHRVRHLLRTGRPADAAALALRFTDTPAGDVFWAYVSVAWRLTGDPRWEWLEGDPRLVGVYDLGDAITSPEALIALLRTLHRWAHHPLQQSLRGGTQTDGQLFPRIEPELRRLRQAVSDAVAAHIAQLPPLDPSHPMLSPRRDTRVRFTGSWSVRLTGGGRHVSHIHPMGWFSSAFYLVVPPPGARGPEPAGWLALGEPPADLQLDLPPLRVVEPKPGRLVLFPSIMWHGTRPFDGGERLTVAFDVARPPAA
ncbi:MAG TPA: putative 2OG-Fe(II) oxygenase, partial [Allosphingosinicella sp.]|nr:putative 2OG-Fe(II) oxygenase [Allosphingosinicella sp.]